MTSRIGGEHTGAISAYVQQLQLHSKQKNSDIQASIGLPEDKIDLSPQARELARELANATKTIRESEIPRTPPARSARIEELAQRVRMGTYQPPSAEIADILAPALRALDEKQQNNA